MHASVAGAHAREVSGIRFRAIAVIGVPSVSISKVYVKRSFAQYRCVGEHQAILPNSMKLTASAATPELIWPLRVLRRAAAVRCFVCLALLTARLSLNTVERMSLAEHPVPRVIFAAA